MEKINDALAKNLKSLRDARRLSLDSLAKLTGVSKSMLAQIERGDANPSISVVWKIANGLGVSFTQLVTLAEPCFEQVRLDALPKILADDGRYRICPVFAYDALRRFEMYYVELSPGAKLCADAHPASAQELLTVSSGCISVFVGEKTLCADVQTAVRFRADLPHVYENPGDEPCRLYMTICY